MKTNLTKIVEFTIDETMELFGIDAISIVSQPAIESNFVYFSEDDKYTLAQVDEDKRMLIGAALIPNKQILRMNRNTNEEYYGHFTKETVAKGNELFLKSNSHHNFTLQHEGKVGGVTFLESWIVEDEVHDKSRKFGLNVPIGTWMVGVRVDSAELWAMIKNEKVRGFSIEGHFAENMKFSEVQTDKHDFLALLDEIEKEYLPKSQ